MKKLWSILCVCAMVLGMMPAMVLSVSAATEGDFEYQVIGDGIVTITQYTGSETDLSIPSKLGEYTVTAIGDPEGGRVFRQNNTLKSVAIPNGVTSIGSYIFSECALLTNVIFPNSLESIGSYLFSGCDSLRSITIPANVTKISQRAFLSSFGMPAIKTINVASDNQTYSSREGVLFNKDKTELICYPAGKQGKYEIPSTVSAIGNSAFSYCDGLTSVTIPASVTSIGNGAFYICDNLTSVIIPPSVKNIGNGAFEYCRNLVSVTISNGVQSIGQCAFSFCRSLKSVRIPSSVMSTGASAFTYSGLERVVIENGVTEISAGSFAECRSLVSIFIPVSVTTIDYNAFMQSNKLTDVYYTGDEVQWNGISIGYNNRFLTSATIHYNCSFATITAEPATAAYANHNAYASVSVTAEGDGLTYTWYAKDPGDSKYYKSSITTATYKAKMTSATSGRLAYCVVKDKYGNKVQSKTFVLRRKATITKEPATAAYAKKGATVSVKIGAAGDGLKYTWYIKNASGTKYSKSSITSATYSATMSSTVKGRRVYCVVKDKYGKTVQSKTFLLREAVSITTQPKTAYAKSGAKVSTSVKASGDGLTYTWYIKNAGKTLYSKSSVTKATYSTTMNSTSKNRLVYCVVKDKYGKSVKSTTVQLKMK